jgi:hypothetical protein
MTKTFNIELDRDGDTITVCVEATYRHPVRAYRGRGGEQMEPDEPGEWEVEGVTGPDKLPFDATDDDMDRITEHLNRIEPDDFRD